MSVSTRIASSSTHHCYLMSHRAHLVFSLFTLVTVNHSHNFADCKLTWLSLWFRFGNGQNLGR